MTSPYEFYMAKHANNLRIGPSVPTPGFNPRRDVMDVTFPRTSGQRALYQSMIGPGPTQHDPFPGRTAMRTGIQNFMRTPVGAGIGSAGRSISQGVQQGSMALQQGIGRGIAGAGQRIGQGLAGAGRVAGNAIGGPARPPLSAAQNPMPPSRAQLPAPSATTPTSIQGRGWGLPGAPKAPSIQRPRV